MLHSRIEASSQLLTTLSNEFDLHSRENKIAKTMRKYDKEGNHKLDKNELGVMLQDLAGGEQPTEDELR